VNWKFPFARLSWDLHSALGFWAFFCSDVGISGLYFAFPQPFNAVFGLIDPGGHFTDSTLAGLSSLHFGRFGWFAEAVWTLLGLMPAVLAVTGVFLCCRRMIFKAPLSDRTSRALPGSHIDDLNRVLTPGTSFIGVWLLTEARAHVRQTHLPLCLPPGCWLRPNSPKEVRS